MPSFTVDDVNQHRDRLWEYVVQPEASTGPGWVHLSVAACEQLGAGDRDLRTLKARERRELYLQALGYRYHEIARLTNSTYTAVIWRG